MWSALRGRWRARVTRHRQLQARWPRRQAVCSCAATWKQKGAGATAARHDAMLWSINSDGVRCLRHIDAALRTATSAGNIAAAGTGPGRHSFDVASTHRARACAAAAMLWIIIYSDGIRCLRHADAALHTATCRQHRRCGLWAPLLRHGKEQKACKRADARRNTRCCGASTSDGPSCQVACGTPTRRCARQPPQATSPLRAAGAPPSTWRRHIERAHEQMHDTSDAVEYDIGTQQVVLSGKQDRQVRFGHVQVAKSLLPISENSRE